MAAAGDQSPADEPGCPGPRHAAGSSEPGEGPYGASNCLQKMMQEDDVEAYFLAFEKAALGLRSVVRHPHPDLV